MPTCAGRLNPRYFLGGEIELDVEQARRAIQSGAPKPLEWTWSRRRRPSSRSPTLHGQRAAAGLRAARLRPPQLRPGRFRRAGPVHANRLAAEIEIATTLIPPSPGTFSALGLLVSDLKHDYSALSCSERISLTCRRWPAPSRGSKPKGTLILAREGIGPSDRVFQYHADLRYVGQSFELTIRWQRCSPDRHGRSQFAVVPSRTRAGLRLQCAERTG